MEAPFDRGEIDRSSLDATERLRARLSGRPSAPAAPPQRRVLPWVIAGGLFVFSAGMIANPWFETNVRGALPFAQVAKPASDSAEIDVLRDRLARLEAPVSGTMPVERLARNEARIENSSDQIAREADRIDRLTSQIATLEATLKSDRARSEAATATAIAAADRAQAMLSLVLVRRAIESGRLLGGLDPMLRQSFEARYPAAVKSVTALGSMPVTLASLRRDYEAMRPAIGANPAAGARLSWWDTLTSKVASAVTSAPTSPGAAGTAEAALQRGDYQAAAVYLRKLPAPRPAALTNWLAAAERLQAGMQGLAVLETATLLAPATAAPAVPVTPAAPAAEARSVALGGAASSHRPGIFAAVGDAVHRALDLRGVLAF